MTVLKRPRGRPRLAATQADATLATLDRAVVLLRLLATHNGLSLTALAEAAALPPSSTHRLLTTLQHHGLVEFEEPVQLWHIGAETFRIGSSFLRRRKIAERGRAVMQSLVERSGETANLAVAEEDGVVFVSQVETHAPIRAFFRPGTRSPYHASGVGKAILSALDPAALERRLATLRLERFTARTLADVGALKRDLARARQRGFAIDDEERYEGMRCVAAAIRNEHGEPIAGLSISGPALRMSRARLLELGPEVARAADDITRSIGGSVPDRAGHGHGSDGKRDQT